MLLERQIINGLDPLYSHTNLDFDFFGVGSGLPHEQLKLKFLFARGHEYSSRLPIFGNQSEKIHHTRVSEGCMYVYNTYICIYKYIIYSNTFANTHAHIYNNYYYYYDIIFYYIIFLFVCVIVYQLAGVLGFQESDGPLC